MTMSGLENACLICHQLKTTVAVEAERPVTDSGGMETVCSAHAAPKGISVPPPVPRSLKQVFIDDSSLLMARFLLSISIDTFEVLYFSDSTVERLTSSGLVSV